MNLLRHHNAALFVKRFSGCLKINIKNLTAKLIWRIVRLSDAGWSSMVARRAHNPKVVGSNPAPATKFQPLGIPSGFVLSFAGLLVYIRYNKQNFTVFLRDRLCDLTMKLLFMAQPAMVKCFARAIGQNGCAVFFHRLAKIIGCRIMNGCALRC